MKPRWALLSGVMISATGVALGAFGAHGLKQVIGDWYTDASVASTRLENWETGVRYQMFHGLALLLIGLALLKANLFTLRCSANCFLLGSVVFSGSLYCLVLTGQTYWGAVTPIGGLLQLAGWLLAGLGFWHLAAPKSQLMD